MNCQKIILFLLIIIISFGSSYLENIWMKYLMNNETKLEAYNAKINHKHLYQLEIFSNSLTYVDLSINNKIVQIDFLRPFKNLTTLKLSLNRIKNIEPLAELNKLEILDLSSNLIVDLRPIKSLTNLIELKVNFNKIKSIDFIFANLFYLVSIDVSDNLIEEINIKNSSSFSTNLVEFKLANNFLENIDSFGYLIKLQIINLNNNNIRYFNSESIRKLTNLNHIFMESNQIVRFDEFGQMINLEYFNLANNLIKNIDFVCKDFSIISKLKGISLNKNQIENANCLLKLNNLRSLLINKNKLNQLDYLDNLTNLSSLDLSFNNLNELKINRNLDKLNYISLKNNNFVRIEFISRFVHLTYLDLSFNIIKNIDSLKNLTNLGYLSLSNNQIEDANVLKHLKNLHTLYLNHNFIFNLDFIGHLNLIYHLEVNSNKLNNIDWIKNFNLMKIFYSSDNEIESIDDNLFDRLDLLKKLDLSRNKIKCLKSLSNLTNIVFLNISFNRLENIDFIMNYSKLRQILVENNNISKLNFNTLFNKNNQDLSRIDLSFNSIKTTDSKIDLSNNDFLLFFYIDTSLLNQLAEFKNIRMSTKNHAFIKSLYIITKNDVNFIDCKLIFSLLKRNIHLNMFYAHQIERFIKNCKLRDIQ